jgi:17beta-estradiol 17-dehydrogenase / very-long-chain 3-oxoacyl-CoA reductase
LLQKLTPNAEVRILVMDARTATPSEMASAVQSISDLHVSILVNNVGGMPIKPPPFRTFATWSCDDVDATINQNNRFMARLTTLMLPLLTKKEGGGRSLILNISSAAYVGMPYLLMYGATKGFINSFSTGLARELCSPTTPETNHIDVLAIIPGEVHSQGNAHGVSASEPTSDVFAECIVRKAENAVQRHKRELRPWMMHDFQGWMLSILPEGIKTRELGKASEYKKGVFNEAWEKSMKDR